MEDSSARFPPRYTSLESLQHGNVLVKKRHSTYSLGSSGPSLPPAASHTPTPPLPTMPSQHSSLAQSQSQSHIHDQPYHPSRPPRNPARSHIPPVPSSNNNSPTIPPFSLSTSSSTASLPSAYNSLPPTTPGTSSSQPFVVRKLKSSPYNYKQRPSTADSVFAPSFASRASAFSATSAVSGSSAGSRDKEKEKERKQVTPWEFQDLMEHSEREVAVPAHLVDVALGGVATPASAGAGAAAEMGVGNKLTGRVEEVTPWEMHAPPSPAISEFSSSSHSNANGRARSSTNTSYASNASTSTSSTGKSIVKSTSTSGSSNKSVGSGLVTPTPYAMRFSSAQTQIQGPPHHLQEMREVNDQSMPLSLSSSAMASTSTLGSVGSLIHRQQDQAHFPVSSASSYSGDHHINYADVDPTNISGTNTPFSVTTPLPLPVPPSPLRSAPSMSSLKSPTPMPTTSTTSTKRVPTPLPLKAAASTGSVAPSIASARSTLSTTSASSKEKPPMGGSTGTVEDVTPWELYPAPALLPLSGSGGVLSPHPHPPSTVISPPPPPPPLPPLPPTPGGKEKERKRRSSVSMSLEERRKSASGGVAGAFSNMSMSMGLGLGKTKTREKEKERERERNGSLLGHANTPHHPPHPIPHSQVHAHAHATPLQPPIQLQSSQSRPEKEKDREARVATGLKEDVTPWELEDVVVSPPAPGVDSDPTAQYVEIVDGRKKSASGTPTPITATGLGLLGVGVAGEETALNTARARGSMTLEQMEEVMPWELYPIPTEVGKTMPSGSFPPPVEGGSGMVPPPQQARQSTTASASASTSTSGFADFGLKRRKSTGAGGGTPGGGAGKTRTAQEKEREREAVVAVSNALAGSTPLPGSSSSSGQSASKEARDRSRLSGLVGISSHDVNLNGLPHYHQHPHPHQHPHQHQHPVPASPSYPSSSTSISPIASSSGHFSAGISSSNSSLTHVNHGSISATLTSSTTPTSVHAPGHAQINGSKVNSKARVNGKGNTTPQFSTADRKVLEQIIAGTKAREAQFVVKGIGQVVPGGGRSEGKKHHPFPRQVVPYPRSYGREVVDLDIWETQFCMDLCDSLTWHVFETPPTKVLEIGCGTGTWIMHCAKTWKDSHFVGLDIVPLHPDLQIVGSPDLASRITWIQHNFLEGLPFQNEEFDFVHIKRIALGVPEDQWDPLLDEIARVMKPGAALELIEEDLFFPGRKKDDPDDTIPGSAIHADDASSITRRNSMSSDQHSVDKHSEISDLDPPTTPTSAHITPSGRLPSRPPSPGRHHMQGSRLDVNDRGMEELAGSHPSLKSASSSSVQTNFVAPHSRSTARPSLTVKTQKGSNSSGLYYSEMAANPPIYGTSVGILGGMGYMASEDPFMTLLREQKLQQRTAAAAASHLPAKKAPTLSNSRVDPNPRSTSSKTVTDPRDHTMLEAIWNGMLDTRFVNRTPLSMLTTYLEYHFTDVRTHPPLIYTFPVSHPTEYWDSDPESDTDSDSEEDDDEPPTPPHHEESDPDIDDARDAIVPRPHSIKSDRTASSNSATLNHHQMDGVDDNSPWRDLQKRLEVCYPFITLDGSRVWSRMSPHNGAKLPNTTLKIDTKSLNQHLALRAKEVIACSESMWEWVVERQVSLAEKEAEQGVRFRSGSTSIETYMVGVPSSASDSSLDLTQNAILEMTRDDFNHLMNNFHLDMEDKASLGHAIQERFDWPVFQSHVTQDRKAFNKACRKYDRWVARKLRRARRMATNPYRQTSNHHSRNSMSASAPGLVFPPSELHVPHDYNIMARSSSTPQPSTVDHRTDDMGSIATAVNSRQDPKSSQAHLPSHPITQTFSLSQLSPEQRMSRAMRVFVAWKAS